MLAWERQPDETAKAFEAFCLYRDMGTARSLAKVGQMLGKSVGLMERWSSQHSWVDRVEALEARDEMLRREAVESHVKAHAEDRARREAALQDRGLGVREAAMGQAEAMVKWPLSEQTMRRTGPDGEEATYVFAPAGWSKATVVAMYNLALGNAQRPDAPTDEAELFDFSDWSQADMLEFLRLSERLVPKRKE